MCVVSGNEFEDVNTKQQTKTEATTCIYRFNTSIVGAFIFVLFGLLNWGRSNMEKLNAGQKIFQQTSDETNDCRAILPPDHPLLEKFQKALKEHLLKINNHLSDEISQIDHNINRLKKEQENVGETLYDYQHEIEQQKELLDEYNERLNEVSEKRLKNEINASKLKRDYTELTSKFQEASRNHDEKLMELTQTRLLENNISKWTQEIEDEVKAAKRVVSKDKQNQGAISQEKRQMDLILFNLEGEVSCNSFLDPISLATYFSMNCKGEKTRPRTCCYQRTDSRSKWKIGIFESEFE